MTLLEQLKSVGEDMLRCAKRSDRIFAHYFRRKAHRMRNLSHSEERAYLYLAIVFFIGAGVWGVVWLLIHMLQGAV